MKTEIVKAGFLSHVRSIAFAMDCIIYLKCDILFCCQLSLFPLKIQPFSFYPIELSGQMKMLYSPPQYAGNTTHTSISHLMQDGDSLPPAVSNPNGVATLQATLSCITGNESIV